MVSFAHPRPYRRSAGPALFFAFALLLALGACSDSDDPGTPGTTGTTPSGVSGETGTTPTGTTPTGTTPTGTTPTGTTPTGTTPTGTTPTGTTPTGSTVVCTTEETLCTDSEGAEYCADLDTDVANCGGCGDLCDLSNADAACVDGACIIDTCSTDDRASCDGDDATGCEANLAASNTHCGACDTPCDLPGAVSTCEEGACELLACIEDEESEPLFANCDEDESTGCEANLLSSRAHCGACDVNLDDLPNVEDARCEEGEPDIRTCAAGFANCDGDWSTGCEADISTDATCGPTCLDCGTLGDGTVAFTCQPIGNTFACQDSGCAAGFGTCGTDDDCQTNLLTSDDHCGQCDEACEPINNSSATCADGTCEITCDGDRELCPAVLGTQICADTQTSNNHCGECGNNCGPGEACVDGQCRCADGFTTCGGGCFDLNTSRDHCGTCNNDCPGTGGGGVLGVPDRCVDGSCYCDEGTTYCRGTNASNSPSCCDESSEVCSGSFSIRSCECAAGYTDCGSAGNRNCVNTTRDRFNCGSCGNTCLAAQVCIAGGCQFIFNP